MDSLRTSNVERFTELRGDFPVLRRQCAGRSLIYLDSTATSLKPVPVIQALCRFYEEYTANIHRAVHLLSEEATEGFEEARHTIARFINADGREVAFVRTATEALNVVASAFRELGPVAVPLSEHHSNLLPWRLGQVVPLEVLPSGQVDLAGAERKLGQFVRRLLAFTTISNALGTRQPFERLSAMARDIEASVLLDISQSVGHEPVDVQELDCDFACFSGHKMLGPSGIGVLYQREGTNVSVAPLLLGGSMIHEVHRDSYTLQPFPWCIEAGTPHIEGAIGLAAACDYLDHAGLAEIHEHCRILTARAREGLLSIPCVRMHGGSETVPDAILAFSIDGMPAHGVARILSNRFGIMVRSGYHCAQPLHEECRLPESVRLSVHLYNTHEEIEALIRAVATVAEMA